MNKRVALSILLILAVLSFYVTDSLTGLITGVAVSILPVNSLQIKLEHPSIINYTNRINISVEVFNAGSTTVEERIEIRIRDTNLTVLSTFLDGYATLYPGQRRGYDVTYLPNMTGFHWIYVSVPFGTGTATKWGLFYVKPPDPIYVYLPETGGGGGAGETPITEQSGPVITDLDVEYQENIVMVRKQSYITPIVLRNVGNYRINNISFDLDYMIPVADLMPNYIDSLEPGESSILLLYLTVPKEFDLGYHPIAFLVTGNNKTLQMGQINLEVRESNLKEEAYSMLTNYMYLSHVIEREMLLLSAKGVNVSTVSDHLNIAREGLETSLELFNREAYQEVIDKLTEDVKPELETALRELSALELPVSLFLSGFLPYLLLILVLLLIPLMLLVFWRFRKRHENSSSKEIEET